MEKKTCIAVCTGCTIGEKIDIASLVSKLSGDKNVAGVVNHSALCSEEGYRLLLTEQEKTGASSVLIAACSPRYMSDRFAMPEQVMLERVNIREQVAWVSDKGEEDAEMAAADYIRMGLAKLEMISQPQPYIPEQVSREILVVGGGISGVTAALEGAKAGYRIHLVEKEEVLGGLAAKLYRQTPYEIPYKKLMPPLIAEKLEALKKEDKITVHTSTTIAKISGEPGNFTLTLQKDSLSEVKVGAIIPAMGMKPYDPAKLGHLAYGKSDKVLTNVQFETLMKEGRAAELPARVLFVQCAGSRDKDHLPYCSSFCCNTSLKQAKYIRETNTEAKVFIIYKDMRTPGLYEGFYKEVQKDDGVYMTKGEVTAVEDDGTEVTVRVKDSLLGEEISIKVDMVVLATGVTPAGTEDLNLAYRQGKGLPELKYNFSDSHFICFPYETRRTGIYAAGALRAPMDIASSMEDAGGAMLKAIQCIESTARGEAVHPRAGDVSYPKLYLDRCTDCKRCTEECPFGTYDENAKGTPIVNPARCRRCGICMGACPERVISFDDYSVNSVSAMIKAVEIPDEFEEKPRILAFVCENDAYPAFDMAAAKGLKYSAYVRIIPVRCIGSVNKVWISDALSCGYDGILQIGCKPGDDYQCHFIHGSELTEKRGENISETLETMMLEPERIRTEFVEITDYQRIPEIINEYVEEIELMGPNPFKGM